MASRTVTPLRVGASDRLVLAGLSLPLVGGKWGSYVGLSDRNLLLSDVLVGAGAAGLLLSLALARGRTRAVLPLVTSVALVLFALLQFDRGTGAASLRLRDLAPFLYLALTPLLAAVVRRTGAGGIVSWLRWTTGLHALWSVPALLGVLPAVSVPWFSGIAVFTVRPDIDVPLLAAFGLLLLVAEGVAGTVKALVLAACVAAGVVQSSRAALLAALAGALVMAWTYRRQLLSWDVARQLVPVACLGLAVAVVAIGVLGLPPLADGALARSGLLSSSASDPNAADGQATSDARRMAWRLTIDHWHRAGSPALGLGPGTEIVADSGALTFLSGDPNVRAPHSWWVNCLARYGPVGLVLFVLALLALSRRRRANGSLGHRPEEQVLLALGRGIAVAIVVGASLGVLIESPFGAYPLSLALAMWSLCSGSDSSAVAGSVAGSGSVGTEPLVGLDQQLRAHV